MKDDRSTTNGPDVAAPSASRNALSSLDGHIPVLDGVRGLAILLVLAYHFYRPGAQIITIVPKTIAQAGWAGVDLFFVLSGFLITGILFKTKADPHYLRNFYMRRTLRIFPLYYGFLACLFGVGTLVTSLNTPGFRHVAEHQIWLWTYTTNIGRSWSSTNLFAGDWVQLNHLWSLAVEEQFYLFWPAIVLFFSRRALKRVCVLIIAGAFIFRIVSIMLGIGSVLWRADALIVGGLIAILLRDPVSAPRMKELATRTMLLTGCLLLGLVVWRGGLHQEDAVVRAVGMSTIILFFGAVLIVIMSLPTQHWCAKFFNLSMLKSFGKYSYAIYIFHFGLSRLVLDPLFSTQTIALYTGSWLVAAHIQFALKVAASFGVAWLSWHVYEKHFLKLKRLFVCKSTSPPAIEPGVRSRSGVPC